MTNHKPGMETTTREFFARHWPSFAAAAIFWTAVVWAWLR